MREGGGGEGKRGKEKGVRRRGKEEGKRGGRGERERKKLGERRVRGGG